MWLRNPRLSTELSFKTHWDPVAPLFHGQELISKTSQRLCLIDVEERGDVGWDNAMAFPSPLVDEVTGSCWKVHVYPSEDGQCLVYFKRKLGPRTAASWNFCLCSQLYKSPFCWWQIHHIFIHFRPNFHPFSRMEITWKLHEFPHEFHHLCRSWILALHSPSCRSMARFVERKTMANFMGIPMRFYQTWGFLSVMKAWDVYDMSPTKRLIYKGFIMILIGFKQQTWEVPDSSILLWFHQAKLGCHKEKKTFFLTNW